MPTSGRFLGAERGALRLCAVAALLAGCEGGAPSEATSATRSAIQGGVVDTTHSFAVGIAQLSQLQSHEVVFCSGALLAPNLVATARHCVVMLASPRIDCATSMFGSPLPTSDVLVTADPDLTPTSHFVHVTQILEPTGPDQTKVCGNDIALLILDHNIELPQYVTPTINPPMTDGALYSTTVATIGYGINAPTDDGGSTAGVRRIKENVALACVPNDAAFDGCFGPLSSRGLLTESEFVSGDSSTCEGDSGSGAFDQASFDRGKWFGFGVLSRGAVSADGETCVQPIYARFDAWGPLLVDAATRAASAGGYDLPAWAKGPVAPTATNGGSGGCNATTRTVPARSVGVLCTLGVVVIVLRRRSRTGTAPVRGALQRAPHRLQRAIDKDEKTSGLASSEHSPAKEPNRRPWRLRSSTPARFRRPWRWPRALRRLPWPKLRAASRRPLLLPERPHRRLFRRSRA